MPRLSSRYPFVILLTLVLAVLGWMALERMTVSLYPTVERPVVRMTIDIDQDAQGFQDDWGLKIETSLLAIRDVDQVEGQYRQGRARYFVHFDWVVDSQTALRDVANIASFYQSQLPDHLPPVRVELFDPGSENYVAIRSDEMTADELSRHIEAVLLPRLSAIDGVANAWVSQRGKPYVLVAVDPELLLRFQTDLTQVVAALQRHRFDLQLGRVNVSRDSELVIRYDRRAADLQQLRDIPLAVSAGRVLRLGEVASVSLAAETDQRFFLVDGQEVVAVAVWPEPDTDLYALAGHFMAAVTAFAEQHGSLIVLNDPREFINDAILNVVLALLLGIAAASGFVFWFYRHLPTALLVCFSMPLALSVGLGGMYLFGVGINLLSLGAMAISIGMVVDGSILVLDSISRQLQRDDGSQDARVWRGVRRIAPAVLTSTMTSIIVFLPLVYTRPMVASLLSDIALVITAILLASLLLSLVFVPALYAVVLRRGWGGKVGLGAGGWLLRHSERVVLAVVRRLLLRRRLRRGVLLGILAGVIVTIGVIAPQLPREIIAEPKAQIIDVHVVFQEDGILEARKIELLRPLEQQILERVGRDVKLIYTDVRTGDAYLSLHLRSYTRYEPVFATLRETLKDTAALAVDIQPWVTSALKIELPPTLSLRFQSSDESVNRRLMTLTQAFLEQRPELHNLQLTPPLLRGEEIRLVLREDFLGAPLDTEAYRTRVQRLTDNILHGADPQKLYDIDTVQGDLALRVGLKDPQATVDMLRSLPLRVDDDMAYVGDFVTFGRQDNWRQWASLDARALYRVEVWLRPGADAGALLTALREVLQAASGVERLPLIVEDSGRETRQALASILASLALSFVIVLLVLLLQFGRISRALIVVSVAGLGVAGAVLALFAFTSPLSLNAVLGMLILVGLTVNSSIILVDFYGRLRAMGEGVDRAIEEAVRQRLRTVLVTTLTTVAGMTPLVIGMGPGEDILKPLGISVAFGLLIAMAATFLLVPGLLKLSEARTG